MPPFIHPSLDSELALVNEPDTSHMQRALELAARGEGRVEPNPMVGCVVVKDGEIVGEGWHQQFGGPHAEVHALAAAGAQAQGATLYVTLEPCCHHGKTPPCTRAILQAGIARVVVALRDPFPQVAGGGLAELAAAGVAVEVGLLEADARQLLAPFAKRVATGRPWMIGKWAMTLDGKIATRAGESKWISGRASRDLAHALRGRVDAILVGRRTAELDDPLLTARPAGPRIATRIVVDSDARLALTSQLVQTAHDAPVLLAVAETAPAERCHALAERGVEVLRCPGEDHAARLNFLLEELGRRAMTNVLVEGGGELLGGLADLDELDELHVFIAPTLFGGAAAPAPLAGQGVAQLAQALRYQTLRLDSVGDDVYLFARRRS